MKTIDDRETQKQTKKQKIKQTKTEKRTRGGQKL